MKILKSHEEIRRWAERHKAQPQVIDSPDAEGDEVGIRFDFEGDADEHKMLEDERLVHETSWDTFFAIMDDQGLAVLVEKDDFEVDPSNRYRFIRRDQLPNEG